MKVLISAGLLLALGGCVTDVLGDPAAAIGGAAMDAATTPLGDAALARSERLSLAWEEAEAKAAQPGDVALPCNQLWAQQDAALRDPAIIAKVETLRTNAEKDAAAGIAGTQLGMTRAGVGAVIGNLPNGQIINIIGLVFQATINIVSANIAQSKGAAMEADMRSIMPAYARASRLGEIAQQKSCPTQ
jgi:hypothetical protein